MDFRQENGNVLFLILIAVALFAALSYAVTLSSRSGGSDASKEQASLYASQIVQSVLAVDSTITRLKISNDCSDEQINFENPINNPYSFMLYGNTNAPADKSCNVFAKEGGGLAPVQLPPDAFIPCCLGNVTTDEYRYPRFSGEGISVIGTTEPELEMVIGNLKKNVCLELNKKLGVDNPGGEPPPVSGTCYNGQTHFTGVYGSTNTTWCGIDQTRAACVFDGAGPHYYFYNVLLVR